MPARLDIAVQRNEAYAQTWILADDTGAAIDLTGMTVAMKVREKASNLLVQTATIEVTDAAAGEITITLDASMGNPLHLYGDPLYTYELPYDLVVTDVDGLAMAITAGYVILSRGIT